MVVNNNLTTTMDKTQVHLRPSSRETISATIHFNFQPWNSEINLSVKLSDRYRWELTWFSSSFAAQQGQLDVVHVCSLSRTAGRAGVGVDREGAREGEGEGEREGGWLAWLVGWLTGWLAGWRLSCFVSYTLEEKGGRYCSACKHCFNTLDLPEGGAMRNRATLRGFTLFSSLSLPCSLSLPSLTPSVTHIHSCNRHIDPDLQLPAH